MIIREKDNWLRLLFVWHGSVLPQILPRLLVLLLLSVAVVVGHGQLFHYKIPLNASAFTLFGITLAIFLGFYNNASYDRFWEGRKLWGALLNNTRSLYRQAFTMSNYEMGSEELVHFKNLLIAFVHALKHQLRQTDSLDDMQRLLPPPLAQSLQKIQYKPVIIMHEMGKWLQKVRKEGKIDSITVTAFDHNF